MLFMNKIHNSKKEQCFDFKDISEFDLSVYTDTHWTVHATLLTQRAANRMLFGY